MTSVVTRIRTYASEPEAVRAMQNYAKMLRQRRATGRYSVFIEKQPDGWWLNLIDRKAR